MSYLLAVDAGNTKTVALVARSDGTIIGAGRAGCGDIYANPSLKEIDLAVAAALHEAGCAADDILAGGFSIAGADWPEDYAFLDSAFARRGWGRERVVLHDSIAALIAGSPDGAGVAVVCGTGVATGARSAAGKVWHASFWQEAGGARHLGEAALRACCRAELGIDPPSRLPGAVARFFGKPDFEAVLHWRFTRDEALGYNLPFDAAVLAPVLLDAAAEGDAAAVTLVAREGRTLGEYALAAARQVGLGSEPFHLVLAGGVFRHTCPLLSDAMITWVQESMPDARPSVAPLEPVVGAMIAAMNLLGRGVDEPTRDKLKQTLPHQDLFQTHRRWPSSVV